MDNKDPPKGNGFDADYIKRLIENCLAANNNPRESELSKGFIFSAREDLNAAELLYKNEIFSLAIYHLQQAAEKLLKSRLLVMKIISEAELKEIGHTTPKGFLKLLRDKNSSMILEPMESNLPPLGKNLTLLDDLINNIEWSEWALMSEELIIKKLDEGYPEYFQNLVNKLGILDDKFLELLSKEIKKHLNIEANIIPNKDLIMNVGLAFSKLFPISLITFTHCFFTRYPDKAVKPSDYTKEMPIVKCFERIHKELVFVLNAFEKA